jgi:PEP-CTERM motif
MKNWQEKSRRTAGFGLAGAVLLAVVAGSPMWASTSSCPNQDTSVDGCSTLNNQFVNVNQLSNINLGETLSYNFNASASQGTGPFGTVTLVQQANDVQVTVTLNSQLFPNIGFVNSAGQEALDFNIAGNPALNVSVQTSGFSFPGTKLDASPFGSFMYGVHCDICGTGASNPNPGPLVFTVSLFQGTLSVHDFTSNSNGWLFATDIIANGATFDVAAGVPEPATFGLMGGALALLGLLAWRKKALG